MKRIRAGLAAICILSLCTAGCAGETQPDANSSQKQENTEGQELSASLYASAEQAAGYCRDIYEANSDTESLEKNRALVERLGEHGFAAADTENQLNMMNAIQVEEFCASASAGEEDEVQILLVMSRNGIVYYDLCSEDGKLYVQQCTVYWENGEPRAGYHTAYEVEKWEYTQKGYFLFEEYDRKGYDGPPGQTGIRVKPLSDECRELNRKYVRPVGYERNNLLILDWDSEDYGELNFYDMYDAMYKMKYGTDSPYRYDYRGAQYDIPAAGFEEVVQSYLPVDTRTLREKTEYNAESGTYHYRPRGLEDSEGLYGPYPEVTACEMQEDGTWKLTVEAVWVEEFCDSALTGELVVRPLEDGGFQYVSNHITKWADGVSGEWYSTRLTQDEWEIWY